MFDEKTKLIIQNAAETPAGFELIKFLAKAMGAFNRGTNFDDTRREYFNKAKREQALWFMDLIAQYAPEQYLEIHREYAKEKGEQNNGK